MHSKSMPSVIFAAYLASLTSVGTVSVAADDPNWADLTPQELSFAIAVPDGFRLATGDASFAVDYDHAATQLNERFDLRLSLSDSFAAAHDLPGRAYVGGLSASDHLRLVELRQAIILAETAGDRGTGGVSITVTGGCFSGAVPDELPISTWVQLDAETGYTPVTQNQDLFGMLDDPTRQRLISNLRACD